MTIATAIHPPTAIQTSTSDVYLLESACGAIGQACCANDVCDCFNTRSWYSGDGVVYYDGVLMDAPLTGNVFTKSLTINHDVGSGK